MSKKHTPANPALKPLQSLVGAWRSEVRWSTETSVVTHGDSGEAVLLTGP